MNSTNERITKIANYVIREGIANTSSGNWHVSFVECSEACHIPLDWIEENAELIGGWIDGEEEILSETWYDEDDDGRKTDFDINLCGYCCPYWEE